MTTSTQALRQVVLGLLGALVLLQTTGCYSWKVVPVPTPRDDIKPKTIIEVTTTDRHTWRLANIRLSNDSLLGVTATDIPEQVGMLTSSITTTRAKKANTLRTIGVVVLGTTLVGAILSLTLEPLVPFQGGYFE